MAMFPKDCILCDICNDEISDKTFIANQDCFWFNGWLYCNVCNTKYKPESELQLIMEIKKGDDLSNTELAQPITITGLNEDDNGSM